jgi:hypothetical protein
MTTFRATANDTAARIITLRDANTGDVLDLTDVTSVQIKFRLVGETDTLITAVPVVYGTATNGQISVPMTTFLADQDAGFYEGEIQLTYTGGGVQTLQPPTKWQVVGEFS